MLISLLSWLYAKNFRKSNHLFLRYKNFIPIIYLNVVYKPNLRASSATVAT